MLRIFLEVVENDVSPATRVSMLELVCRRWHTLCGDPLLWGHIARQTFVAYSLIIRLEHTAQLTAYGHDRPTLLLPPNAARDVPLPLPNRDTVRYAMGVVQKHSRQLFYYQYVQRRRSFVMHFFLSSTLLCLSLAIGSAMCTAEKWMAGTFLCSANTCFTLLWMCYVCITGLIVSNVVMQAHFVPQPLLLRLQRKRALIGVSALLMMLGIVDVMIPTALIQANMSRETPFSWQWCGTSVMLTFAGWQCYTFISIMPAAKEQLRLQRAQLNVREGIQFLAVNVPNAFPLLFAVAVFCVLQYVQNGDPFYLLLGGVPVVVSLVVLGLVFLLDFATFRRVVDLCVALSLFLAALFPPSLFFWDFRGLSLLPLATSIFVFFLSHARYALWHALRHLRALDDTKWRGPVNPAASTAGSALRRCPSLHDVG